VVLRVGIEPTLNRL